jgi:uncharacterized protein VirK/YbjX
LLRKFLYGGIFARTASTQGAQWKIFEEIIQVYGKMLEGSWPVSMKIALSIKNDRQQFFRP